MFDQPATRMPFEPGRLPTLPLPKSPPSPTAIDENNERRAAYYGRVNGRCNRATACAPGLTTWARAVAWIAPYPHKSQCPGRWQLIGHIVPGWAKDTMRQWCMPSRKRDPNPAALRLIRDGIIDRVNDALTIISELDSEICRLEATVPPHQAWNQRHKERQGRRWAA